MRTGRGLPSLATPPSFPRSMQELLVRFEPPDLLGVPPEDFSLPGDELLKSKFVSIPLSRLTILQKRTCCVSFLPFLRNSLFRPGSSRGSA